MMVPVRLETAQGELVSDQEAILPFNVLPGVVQWGARTFRLHSETGHTDPYGRSCPVYRECFIYFITGLEKQGVRPPEPSSAT